MQLETSRLLRPAGSGSPTVTIEGRREQERIEAEVHSFVSTIAVTNWDEPLARWEEPICPLVVGLPAERGGAVLWRVSEIAADAGVRVDPHGCAPNLMIIADRDPAARLQQLWTAYPKMMNDDRGRGGIDRFIHGSQPMRAWQNACSEAPSTAAKGVQTGARCSKNSVGSLLSYGKVRSIYSAIVVLDLNQTKEFNDRQIAAYAAMIALAQTRDNSVPSMPSILSLLGEPGAPKPQDLSSWDRAFLKALYTVNPGDASQAAEIAHEMQRQLAP